MQRWPPCGRIRRESRICVRCPRSQRPPFARGFRGSSEGRAGIAIHFGRAVRFGKKGDSASILLTVISVIKSRPENYALPLQMEADKSVFVPIGAAWRVIDNPVIDVVSAFTVVGVDVARSRRAVMSRKSRHGLCSEFGAKRFPTQRVFARGEPLAALALALGNMMGSNSLRYPHDADQDHLGDRASSGRPRGLRRRPRRSSGCKSLPRATGADWLRGPSCTRMDDIALFAGRRQTEGELPGRIRGRPGAVAGSGITRRRAL